MRWKNNLKDGRSVCMFRTRQWCGSPLQQVCFNKQVVRQCFAGVYQTHPSLGVKYWHWKDRTWVDRRVSWVRRRIYPLTWAAQPYQGFSSLLHICDFQGSQCYILLRWLLAFQHQIDNRLVGMEAVLVAKKQLLFSTELIGRHTFAWLTKYRWSFINLCFSFAFSTFWWSLQVWSLECEGGPSYSSR